MSTVGIFGRGPSDMIPDEGHRSSRAVTLRRRNIMPHRPGISRFVQIENAW